jgi:hypothetical protein
MDFAISMTWYGEMVLKYVFLGLFILTENKEASTTMYSSISEIEFYFKILGSCE